MNLKILIFAAIAILSNFDIKASEFKVEKEFYEITSDIIGFDNMLKNFEIDKKDIEKIFFSLPHVITVKIKNKVGVYKIYILERGYTKYASRIIYLPF